MISLEDYLKEGTTTLSNLLLQYYVKLDLTEQELIFYLQLLQFQQRGIYFPSLEKIGQFMNISDDIGFKLIQQLINKSIISMDTSRNEFGKTEDRYDLTPVFVKLTKVMEQETNQKIEKQKEDNQENLFNQFEQEFGRALSPIEIETIHQWIAVDKYSIELIELALKEAVLNQAYSLKYIDRILLNWERKNLKTKQSVQKDQKRRLASMENKNELNRDSEDLPTIPMFNWLNPDDK